MLTAAVPHQHTACLRCAAPLACCQALVQQQRMDPRVFSRFRTTYDCGNHTSEQVTWIEPLSHGLRHPNALCNRGANVMDRSYLLLAHRAEHAAAARLGNVQCQGRACQAIYFDLGATTLQPTPDEAGQGWFFKAYQQQGIAFDRYLLWEARPKDPAAVFKHVPKGDMHKYQYFNVPVTSDTSDPSNPVNILKVGLGMWSGRAWGWVGWGRSAQTCLCWEEGGSYRLQANIKSRCEMFAAKTAAGDVYGRCYCACLWPAHQGI